MTQTVGTVCYPYTNSLYRVEAVPKLPRGKSGTANYSGFGAQFPELPYDRSRKGPIFRKELLSFSLSGKPTGNGG